MTLLVIDIKPVANVLVDKTKLSGVIVPTPKYLCNGLAHMPFKLPIWPAVTHGRLRIVTIDRPGTQ